MGYSVDDTDDFSNFSSPKRKPGSVNHGGAFDVQELERKLKSIGDDRRKYYLASPMLTAATPTPAIPETNDSTSGEEILSYRQKFLRKTDIPRRSPFGVVANTNQIFDRGGGGDEISTESNSVRQSTSSSDTEKERMPSSLQEIGDAFLISSERSETFAMGHGNGDLPNHLRMQRPSAHLQRGKPQESMASVQRSPLLYPIGHVESSLKSTPAQSASDILYQDHDYSDAEHSENFKGRSSHGFSWKAKASAMLIDVNTHGQMQARHDEDVEWGGFHSSEYRSPPKDASPASSRSSSRRAGRAYAAELMDKYYQSLSNHQESNYQLPLVQYEQAGEIMRKRSYSSGAGDRFSYVGCKERLLSGRSSFEQSNDTAASEGEVERLSNYERFKLRQNVNNTHGKLSRNHSPNIGPIYSSMQQASRNHSGHAASSRHESYHSTPEHAYALRGPISQRSPVFDSSKLPPPYRRAPNAVPMHNTSAHAYDHKGPSWSNKATLKAVREKIRDPNFQRFSTSMLPAGEARSRVFDSYAMVKSSYDARQDFKESMLEMIFEKDLNSSHDMVELLQCYLTLNPPRCHDTIVKAFTEVWSQVFQDMT